MTNTKQVNVCPECGIDDSEWSCVNEVKSGAVQGCLETKDVQCVFVLGCNYCSHTIQTAKAEVVALAMDKIGMKL